MHLFKGHDNEHKANERKEKKKEKEKDIWGL